MRSYPIWLLLLIAVFPMATGQLEEIGTHTVKDNELINFSSPSSDIVEAQNNIIEYIPFLGLGILIFGMFFIAIYIFLQLRKGSFDNKQIRTLSLTIVAIATASIILIGYSMVELAPMIALLADRKSVV